MEQDEINKRNNAITAYLGGPVYLRTKFWKDLMASEVRLMGIEDLEFNTNWNWAIPAWSQIRKELSPMMVISAISAIDTEDINSLFQILSQVCIDWCRKNNIKLD